PSTSANSVSSLPRPTFFPGFHFVPRWRARMLPPKTCSPPNFFRPKRCECESRPLRDEPTPFLCAMTKTPNAECGMMSDEYEAARAFNSSFRIHHSSLSYRINLHGRVVLPVALRALVLLAALLLEDDDLVAAPVVKNGRGDARALDRGASDLHAVAAAVAADD